MRELHIPIKLALDLTDEVNYGFEKLTLKMSDKGTFILNADVDGEEKNETLIMYMDGWISTLKTPIQKETLDMFIEVCDLYEAMGDNILTLSEYGIVD